MEKIKVGKRTVLVRKITVDSDCRQVVDVTCRLVGSTAQDPSLCRKTVTKRSASVKPKCSAGVRVDVKVVGRPKAGRSDEVKRTVIKKTYRVKGKPPVSCNARG